MQYKSRLSSKPPTGGGGLVQMRIKKGSVGPTNTTSSKGLTLMVFDTQDYVYGDKLRKQQLMKELLIKRALSPPPRRLTLRWKNFQPTPSRLSMMSTA